jgi:hypothetical protein
VLGPPQGLRGVFEKASAKRCVAALTEVKAPTLTCLHRVAPVMADPLESIAEAHEITNARPGDSFALCEALSEDDLIKLIQLFALHYRPYCSRSLPR